MLDIDAVILWVDGDDPEWKAKCEAARGGNPLTRRNDIGGDLRFRQMREIDWCVASINKFAPWIRKIYVITAGQDPHLEQTVGQWFDKPIPVEIVDHSVIFRGYEQYLPTFQCRSIELMMHRIPGLSERFLYFNDDFFLGNHVGPDDFFTDGGGVVEYASWMPNLLLDILHFLKPKKDGLKQVGFKDTMMNAAKMLGFQKTLILRHNPHALLKSAGETLIREYPQCVERNCRDKFRTSSQFNVQEARQLITLLEGKLEIRSAKGKTLFLKPFATRPKYLRNHLEKYTDLRHLPPFMCINSIAMADPADREFFLEFMKRLLPEQFRN